MDKALESEPTVINVLHKMKSDGATQKEFIKYLQDITEKEKRGIRMSRRMARSVLIEWGFIVPRSRNANCKERMNTMEKDSNKNFKPDVFYRRKLPFLLSNNPDRTGAESTLLETLNEMKTSGASEEEMIQHYMSHPPIKEIDLSFATKTARIRLQLHGIVDRPEPNKKISFRERCPEFANLSDEAVIGRICHSETPVSLSGPHES